MRSELFGVDAGKSGNPVPLEGLQAGTFSEDIEREMAQAPFGFEGNEQKYFAALCEHYSQSLRKKYPVVSEKERTGNIVRVNDSQALWLRENAPENDIPFDREKRRLNLYFRTGSDGRTQMDPFEFCVITWILNWYVHGGRSRVFNGLSIVSRLEEDYPHFVHGFSPDIEYLNTRGEEFRRACAVGANTIHLTHGSVIENKYGSVPVIGQSTREDSVAMEAADDYIPLQLYYPEGQRPNARDIDLGETDYSGSFPNVMAETIRAIRALEDRMLSGA